MIEKGMRKVKAWAKADLSSTYLIDIGTLDLTHSDEVVSQ